MTESIWLGSRCVCWLGSKRTLLLYKMQPALRALRPGETWKKVIFEGQNRHNMISNRRYFSIILDLCWHCRVGSGVRYWTVAWSSVTCHTSSVNLGQLHSMKVAKGRHNVVENIFKINLSSAFEAIGAEAERRASIKLCSIYAGAGHTLDSYWRRFWLWNVIHVYSSEL